MKKLKYKKHFLISLGTFFLVPTFLLATVAVTTSSYAAININSGSAENYEPNKNSALGIGNGLIRNIGGNPGRIIDVSPIRDTSIIGQIPNGLAPTTQNTSTRNTGTLNATTSTETVDPIVSFFSRYKVQKSLTFSSTDLNLNFSDIDLFGSEYLGNNLNLSVVDIKNGTYGDFYGDIFTNAPYKRLNDINSVSKWTQSSTSFETISKTSKEKDVYSMFSTYVAGLLYKKHPNSNILNSLLFKDYSLPEFNSYRNSINSRTGNKRTDFVSLQSVLSYLIDELVSKEKLLSQGKNIDIFSMIVLLRIWLLNKIHKLNYGSLSDAAYKLRYEIMYETTLAFDNVMRYINYLIHEDLDQFLSPLARSTNIDEAFEFSSLWFFTRKPTTYFGNLFSGSFTSHYDSRATRLVSRPGFTEIFLISSLYLAWIDSFSRTANKIDDVIQVNREIQREIDSYPAPKTYDVPEYIPSAYYGHNYAHDTSPFMKNPAYNPPSDYLSLGRYGMQPSALYSNEYGGFYLTLKNRLKTYSDIRFKFPTSLGSIETFLDNNNVGNQHMWLDYWYKSVYKSFDEATSSSKFFIEGRINSFMGDTISAVNDKLNELNAQKEIYRFINLYGKLNIKELLKYAIVTSLGNNTSGIQLAGISQALINNTVKYSGEDENWVNHVNSIFELTDKIKSIYFELLSGATFGLSSFVDAVVSTLLFAVKGIVLMSKVDRVNVVYEFNYGNNGGNTIRWDGGVDEISYSFWGDKETTTIRKPQNNMFIVFSVI